ncbi:hypothetical protein, partial [Streptomyces sporangiiformans]
MNDANHRETTATDPRVAVNDPRAAASGPRGAAADPRAAVAQAADDGRGRHRGPVSARDDESTPRGRHRKPA